VTFTWSDQALLELEAARLEIVRSNALKRGENELALRIEALQRARAATKTGGAPSSPVVGFHFTCVDDYEVIEQSDGTFWSGVWTVAEVLCEPARELKGYVALHASKRENSYRQGTIIDWRNEKRTKGKSPMGISFLLEPFETSLPWYGRGAGERGYRRLDDHPKWQMPT